MRKAIATAVAASAVCSAAATAQAGFIGSTVYAGWRIDAGEPGVFGQTDNALADVGPLPEFTDYNAGGWLLDPVSIDFNDASITIDHFAADDSVTDAGFAFNGMVFGLAPDATTVVQSVSLHSEFGFRDGAGAGLDAARATVDPLTHEIRLDLAGYSYVTTSSVTLDVTFADATPPAPIPEPASGLALATVLTLSRRRRPARQSGRRR